MIPQNDAMQGALNEAPQEMAGAQGSLSAPPPAIPPELVNMAYELGLDIRNPEHLAILIQLLGAGSGGPLGPMAGAGPGQAPAPAEPLRGGPGQSDF